MSRSNLMSWNAKNAQWHKMFQGVRYFVSCSQLNAPPTKEGSYQAANEWWRAKLDSFPKKSKIHPAYQRLIDQANEIQAVNELGPRFFAYSNAKELEREGKKKNPKPIDPVTEWLADIQDDIANRDPVFQDRKQILENRKRHVVKDKTLGPNLDRFLALNRVRIKPQSYAELRSYLNNLTQEKFFSRDLPLDEITEQTVNAHFLHLGNRDLAANSKNKNTGFFRRFIAWLDSERLLPHGLPKNLKLRSHRFKEQRKKIKRFDDVAAVVKKLPDEYKLWALLGLNCGMTQADLGAMSWDWIDWKRSTLTRSRVKLETTKNSPETTYKLWPETLQLLKARRLSKGLVFLTNNGEKMYDARYGEAEGESVGKKKDMFSTRWNRFDWERGVSIKNWSENPIPITLGKFRSIGATTLKKRSEYRGFVDVFLANVPERISDKHYADEDFSDACPFFKALEFIRAEIFS